ISSPPCLRMAPATPPPMIPFEFAGLTMASTGRLVMSACATWTCIEAGGEATTSTCPRARRCELFQMLTAVLQGCDGERHSEERSGGERLLELLLDLLLGPVPRDRQLLDDEVLGGVQHPPLAEGEGLGALEAVQVAEDLGDLEQRAG